MLNSKGSSYFREKKNCDHVFLQINWSCTIESYYLIYELILPTGNVKQFQSIRCAFVVQRAIYFLNLSIYDLFTGGINCFVVISE